MREVIIKAVVDLKVLADLLRAMPILSGSIPVAEFDCGQFRCDTIEEVWGLAREMAAADARANYEKLREFAP